ncbi:MAG: putative Ig domain-containing protein [Eubacteriales bacterium]|nr:putative Ig domain-containing protein [Eubacteriales bacterium]
MLLPLASQGASAAESYTAVYSGTTYGALTLSSGSYLLENCKINGGDNTGGITLTAGSTVKLYIKGTVTVNGGSSTSGSYGGAPGIYVPEGTTLRIWDILGTQAELCVYGGKGADANPGEMGLYMPSMKGHGDIKPVDGEKYDGGVGGGAAIGTFGGIGGSRGGRVGSVLRSSGGNGTTAEAMGQVSVFFQNSSSKLTVKGGSGGAAAKGGYGGIGNFGGTGKSVVAGGSGGGGGGGMGGIALTNKGFWASMSGAGGGGAGQGVTQNGGGGGGGGMMIYTQTGGASSDTYKGDLSLNNPTGASDDMPPELFDLSISHNQLYMLVPGNPGKDGNAKSYNDTNYRVTVSAVAKSHTANAGEGGKANGTGGQACWSSDGDEFRSKSGGKGGQAGTAATSYRFPEAPCGWEVLDASTMPDGLTLTYDTTEDDNTRIATLSGVPTQAGEYPVRLKVSNSYGSCEQEIIIVVLEAAEPVKILTEALPDAVQHEAYNAEILYAGTNESAAYGVINVTYECNGETKRLPAGMMSDSPTLRADGYSVSTISASLNAPVTAAPGTYNIKWTAYHLKNSDEYSDSNTKQFTLTVRAATEKPAFTTITLPSAVGGTAYTEQLFASGGNVAYALTEGRLPVGMTLSASGILSGTPTESGDFPITVTATNTAGTTEQQLTLQVAPDPAWVTISTKTLPDGNEGAPYSQQLSATTGSGAIIWSTTNLPTGIALSQTGLLSGTPTVSGDFYFTVTADNGTNNATQNLQLHIEHKPVSPAITTKSLAGGTVGAPYSETLTATGDAPITWSVTQGALPQGLTLDANTGVISGTPTVAGIGTFTITADNGIAPNNASETALMSKPFTITIAPAPVAPTITTETLNGGTVGEAYSQTLTADGDAPLTWRLYSGTMPDGLTLATDGTLSGTPTQAGASSVTFIVSNQSGADMRMLALNIGAKGAPKITFTKQPAQYTTAAVGNITASLTAEAAVLPSAAVTLSWYSCDENGISNGNVLATGTSFTLPTDLEAGVYYYLCEAVSSGAVSVLSNVATVVVGKASTAKLDTPTGLVWDATLSGNAKWNAVTNATGYSVQLYKSDAAQVWIAQGAAVPVIATEYNFTSAITEAGRYAFAVTAVGDSVNYADSDQSAKSAEYVYTAPVVPKITFTTEPAAVTTVTAGNIKGSLSVVVSVSNGNAPTLGWFACNESGVKSGDALGANDTFAIPTSLVAGTYYYLCQATCLGASTVFSSVAKVEVSSVPIPPTPTGLTVFASNQSKKYGQLDPTLNYTATGWVGSDTASLLTGALARDAGETAGYSYTIRQGSLSAGSKYIIDYTQGSLSIYPAAITLQVSSNPGNAAPGTTITLSVGAANGENSLADSGWTQPDGVALSGPEGALSLASVSGQAGHYTASYVIPATTAVGATLTFTATVADTSGNYNNPANQEMTLTVVAAQVAPSIRIQPISQSVIEGEASTFTVAADGKPALGYQWQVSKNGGINWSNVTDGAGGTTTRYTTPNTTTAMNGYQYRCIVSNGVSPNATSNGATLMTIAKPSITTQPIDQYVVVGQQATFTLAATGDGLTYQWYINRNDGLGWQKSSGKTGTSQTTAPVTLENNGYQYGCLLTDAHGNTLRSGIATLYISPAVVPPQTGDNSKPLLWLGMCLLSGLGLRLIIRKKRRASIAK